MNPKDIERHHKHIELKAECDCLMELIDFAKLRFDAYSTELQSIISDDKPIDLKTAEISELKDDTKRLADITDLECKRVFMMQLIKKSLKRPTIASKDNMHILTALNR